MSRPPPRYVVDRVFDSTPVNLDDIIGPNDTATPTHNDGDRGPIWPAVPPHFELPPPQLEDTVKEVAFIAITLKRTLLPTPLPDDDLPLLSDFLLSLETREDLTDLVLAYTELDKTVQQIKRCKITDDSQFNFVSRAKELEDHWRRLRNENKDDSVIGQPPDRSLLPLKTNPEGKPALWKLQLTDLQEEEARDAFNLYKQKRSHALSYFKRHPPRPMAWVPFSNDSWKNTERYKIESGDLYHSLHWKPIYGSWGLLSMDVPFNWKNPDEPEVSEEEQKKQKESITDQLDLTHEMRRARESWLENHKK